MHHQHQPACGCIQRPLQAILVSMSSKCHALLCFRYLYSWRQWFLSVHYNLFSLLQTVTSKFKFNSKSVTLLVSKFFSRNTCSHLAEHSLGNAERENIYLLPYFKPKLCLILHPGKFYIYQCADKSLARPGRKQATATKLELLQSTQKKIQKVVRPTRSLRRTKNGDLSISFSVGSV